MLEPEGATEVAVGRDFGPSIASDASVITLDHEPETRRPVTTPAALEGTGTLIAGKYALIKAIGEGGMGTVYMALQSEPIKPQGGDQTHQERPGFEGRNRSI